MALVDDLLELHDVLVAEEGEVLLHGSQHLQNLEVHFDVLQQQQDLQTDVDDVDDQLERRTVMPQSVMTEQSSQTQL